MNFEESVISSHTATDDEIDFRMILPSESHRRRSLGKTGRSGSIASDPGTVSYSSVSMAGLAPRQKISNSAVKLWVRGGLMVSAAISGPSGVGWGPGRVQYIVF